MKLIEKRFLEITKLNEFPDFPCKELKCQKPNEFNKKKFGEVFTPLHIVDEMIDLMDINPNTKIMDICAGQGQFAIRILKKLSQEFDVDINEFIRENLYFNELNEENVESLKYIFGNEINLIEGDCMRLAESPESHNLDIIIGNPPYNNDLDLSRKPIYHDIVEYILDNLNPNFLCMITPSRWMAGGRGLNHYRKRMMNDKHIKIIKDFPNPCEVFKFNKIASGISYFLWDKQHNGKCQFNGVYRDLNEFDVIIKDHVSASILKKVLNVHYQFLNEKALSVMPFGIPSNFNKWSETGIKCVSRRRIERCVNTQFIQDKHGVLDKYKICFPKARSQRILEREANKLPSTVIGKIFKLSKNECCTETYLIAGAFNSEFEADNYLSYLKTKFFRFMLSLKLYSQNTSRDGFAFVPDLPLNKEITDNQLYQHFNLAKEEKEHIEKLIDNINYII